MSQSLPYMWRCKVAFSFSKQAVIGQLIFFLFFAVEYMFPLRKENAPFAHPYES